MAREVKVNIIVDDDGTMRLTEKSAQKLGKSINSVGVAAATADRRLKGTAQASSNTTKNFSKMAQGITGGLVPAYATLAANIFAITAAFGFFKRAADVSILTESQQQYAASTGVGLRRVAEGLQEASGGMLTFQKASEAAAIGVAKGFSAQQLESLADGARKASAALGRDFEDSFDRLVRGVSKAEPELLDELGITLRLENATRRYSQAIGKAAKDLNTYEKSQAVLVEVQRQLDEQFANFNPRANPFVKLQVTFDRLIKILQKGLLPAAESVAEVLNESPTTALLTFGALGLSIAKSALPIEGWKQDFADWGAATTTALANTEAQLEAVRQASLDAADASRILKMEGEAAAKDAGQLLAGQTDSKFAQRLAGGEKLELIDVKRFDKDLARVEAQIIKNGQVIKGVYKGASLEAVVAMRQALAQIVLANQQAAVKTQTIWEKTFLLMKRRFLEVKSIAIGVAKSIGGAFAFVGKQVGRVIRLVSFVGIFSLATELFGEMTTKLRGWIQSIFEFFDTGNTYIATLVGLINNLIVGFLQGISTVLSVLPIVGDAAGRFADILGESYFNIEQLAKGNITLGESFAQTGISKNLLEKEKMVAVDKEATLAAQRLQSEIESYTTALEELGRVLDSGTALQRANAMTTLNTSSIIRKAEATANKEGANREEILENLKKLYPDMAKQAALAGVVINRGIEPQTLEEFFALKYAFEGIEAVAGSAVGGVEAFKNANESLVQTLGNFKGGADNFIAVKLAIQALDRETENVNKKLSLFQGDLVDTAKEIKQRTGLTTVEIERLAVNIDILEDKVRNVKEAETALQKARLKTNKLVGKAKEIYDDQLRLIEEDIALRKLDNDITQTGLSLQIEKNPIIRAGLALQQQDQLRLLEVQKQRVAAIKEEIDQFSKLNKVIGESLLSNLSSAIQSYIQGTKSFKESLIDFTRGVAQAIADFISQLLALSILKALLPEKLEIALGLKPDPAAYKEVGKAIGDEMTRPEQTDKYKKAVEEPLKRQAKAIKDSSEDLNSSLMDTFSKASKMLHQAITDACKSCKCTGESSSSSSGETAQILASVVKAVASPSGQTGENPIGGTFNPEGTPRNMTYGQFIGTEAFGELKPMPYEGMDNNTLALGADPLGMQGSLSEQISRGIIDASAQKSSGPNVKDVLSKDSFILPSDGKQSGGFLSKIKDIFGSFKDKMGELFSGEGTFLSKLGGIFKGLFDKIGGFFSNLFGGGGVGGGGGIFSTILKGIMGFFGFAMGGIAPGGFRAYANGGIVNRPTLGLIGEGRMNEAVVPLPDGKSIPIEGNLGGGAQTNNVNVSVSVNNEGKANTTVEQDSQAGANLGRIIAAVVQEELQNQKRPGGILSPYGAS